MRIVVAPQEYKGTLTAQEAAEAMAEGAKRAAPDATIEAAPLSDGGPGLVEAILTASRGRRERALVEDPLARTIVAHWALLEDGVAVIESAAAAGLTLLREDERDPRTTTSYGVGQLMLAALDAGCGQMIVGLGGSATNDGGTGMAAALGVRFLDVVGGAIPPGGAALAQLDRIDASGLDPRMEHTAVMAATDVTNPLCGPEGASLVYGPQKGASPEVAGELDAALRRYADIIERDMGVSVLICPGAGSAGGLGAGLIAFADAKLRSGAELVMSATRFVDRARTADLIVTGEGRVDAQSAYGKVTGSVIAKARELGRPVALVGGGTAPGYDALFRQGLGALEVTADGPISLQDAMSRSDELIAAAAERLARALALGGSLRAFATSESREYPPADGDPGATRT